MWHLCKVFGISTQPRPIHMKCKTIHMLSEEGKQSLPEFVVSANYSNPNVDARNLSFKSDKNKSNWLEKSKYITENSTGDWDWT